MTPASVAKDYFRKDIQAHSRTASKVVVFTHDACYGHRFSRPRATKAMLGSIVERPERIQATVLGASTAYVRLGERHKDARYSPHPDRDAPAPPFSLIKSTRSIPLNHPAVTAVHGTKWMESLQVMCDSAEAKLAMGQKELARPVSHQRDSKGNILPALHVGDLYLASESLSALQGCLGGVCDAVDAVFQQESAARRAFVCIRPPGHHCSAEMPSGFCWLNNVHVGIKYAAMNHGLTHAAIIDIDLHHGDGSQTIVWDHNRDTNNMQNSKSAPAHKKTPIGYYSLHDINSYPCEYGDEDKVRNASTCLHTAHGQSIWNVHLESWTSLSHFWTLYESKYKILLQKAESFLEHHSKTLRQAGIEPKAAIFLSSGFDASQWEGEGMQRHQVNVPTDFYAKVTADVVEMAEKQSLGADGRIISVLEGGYSDRALTSGVLSHLCGLTHKTMTDHVDESRPGLNGSKAENKLDYIDHDPAWWHVGQLELLEAMVAGHQPPPTKPNDRTPSSYSSPTHASTAKMTEIAKERKSMSAQIEARWALENAPPEPIPEVDWVTASYELSQLLIPSDRPTSSCTHEELNAENSRARRDRQSLVSLPMADPSEDKIQLRERKPKQPTIPNAPAQPRATSKTANRRTTIAAASELPDPTVTEPPGRRRRSSAASSVLTSMCDLRLDDREYIGNTRASSRPGSAAPSKDNAVLPVARTRAPVKKPRSTASSPRKAKVPPPPMSSRNISAVKEAQVSSAAANDNARTGNTDSIDDLTSGMKKISIKLKMPSEEKHNENPTKTEDTAVPKQKLTRKPPVPKAPKVKTTATNRSTVASQRSSTSITPPTTEAGRHAQFERGPAVESASNVPATHTNPANQTLQSIKSPSSITMPAIQFLSATELSQDQATSPGAVFPDGYKDNDITAVSQNAMQSSDHGIHYPAISLKTDSASPPPSDGAVKREKTAASGASPIWDVPETPHR